MLHKVRVCAFIIPFWLFLLLFFNLAMPVNAALSWRVQVVDANAKPIGNGYFPIAVDSNNNPHIAYAGMNLPDRQTLWSLGYAILSGSDWIIQERPFFGFVTDLKLDANNNPHMMLQPGVTTPLTYARWNGTEWLTQTIPLTEGFAYASLALDPSGNPHVAYGDGEGLKYASWTGSNWTIQTVDASYIETAFMLSLAVDKNNVAHILYANSSKYLDTELARDLLSVKLAVLKDSGWSIEPVLTNYNLSGCWNMVLDSKGYPCFVATLPQLGTTLKKILYVSWDGSAWNTQTVISDVDSFTYSNFRGFLALDAHDNPNIVYSTEYDKLVYAYWTGVDWNIQTVPTSNLVTLINGPCYMAIDSNGNPHISFRGTLPDQVHWFNATVFYVTATGTKEFTQPTATEPPTASIPALPLLLVTTAVIIVVITTSVYVWKKKTQAAAINTRYQ